MLLRKNCRNLNYKKIHENHLYGKLPNCCERCNTITKFYHPIKDITDVEQNNIVIAKNNELYLILSKLDNPSDDVHEIIGSIEAVYAVHVNTNTFETTFNNPTTVIIEPNESSLQKKMIVEFYNNDILAVNDLLGVVSHVTNVDKINSAKIPEDYISAKTDYGLFIIRNILKYRFHDNIIYKRMQQNIEDSSIIN